MLRKRNLLICVVAVAFCLVAIDYAEACDDWYWAVDCYDDYYGNFWVCWWDCYNCYFWWDCLEYSLFADKAGMAVAAYADRNPFMASPMAEPKEMILFRY